jgi:hypothetical protein
MWRGGEVERRRSGGERRLIWSLEFGDVFGVGCREALRVRPDWTGVCSASLEGKD